MRSNKNINANSTEKTTNRKSGRYRKPVEIFIEDFKKHQESKETNSMRYKTKSNMEIIRIEPVVSTDIV